LSSSISKEPFLKSGVGVGEGVGVEVGVGVSVGGVTGGVLGNELLAKIGEIELKRIEKTVIIKKTELVFSDFISEK
jgi:hypothetical protein